MKQGFFKGRMLGIIALGCAAVLFIGMAVSGAQEDQVILQDDFQQYPADAGLSDCISLGQWTSTLANNDKRGASIFEEENGNKALMLWAKKTSTEPYAIKKLEPLSEDSRLLVRFKVRVGDAQAYVSLGTKSNEICRFNKGVLNLYDQAGGVKNVSVPFDPQVLEDFMALIDCGDGSVKLYYNGGYVDEGYVKAHPFDLAKAQLQLTAKFMGGQAEPDVLFDEVQLVDCSGEGYSFTVEEKDSTPVNEMYLTFAMPMDETTFSPDAVRVSGPEELVSSAMEKTERGWRVTFPQDLRHGEQYTVEVSGPKDILGRDGGAGVKITTRTKSFAAEQAKLYIDYVSEESQITALLPGNLIAAVSARNELDEEKTVTLCAVVYNADGSVEQAEKRVVSVAAKEAAVVTCPISVEDTAGKKLAVYAWDSFAEQNSYGATQIFE